MKAHLDRSRNQLADLASLAGKTERAERRILESAADRLETVQTQILRLRAGIEAAGDAEQDRYLELIEERAKLHRVVAKSRAALGGG